MKDKYIRRTALAIFSGFIILFGIYCNNIVLNYYSGVFPVVGLAVQVGDYIPLIPGMKYYWLADAFYIQIGSNPNTYQPIIVYFSVGDVLVVVGFFLLWLIYAIVLKSYMLGDSTL